MLNRDVVGWRRWILSCVGIMLSVGVYGEELAYSELRALYRSGVVDLENGEVSSGIEKLTSARDAGLAVAMAELGFFALHGIYMPKDLDQAESLYAASIAQGESRALSDLGIELLYGDYLPQDEDRALKHLNQAARLGNDLALLELFRYWSLRDGKSAQATADGLFALVDPEYSSFWLASLAVRHRFNAPASEAMSRFEYWSNQIEESARPTAIVDAAISMFRYGSVRRDIASLKAMVEENMDYEDPSMVNRYAWLLATTRRKELRNGELALAMLLPLKEKIASDGYIMDTLAAAYAADGQFPLAVEAQTKALALVDADVAENQSVAERLELYKRGESWFE
ncbi:MAG: hypothetical protein AAAFM81_09115 [Pseudomonadota bacterium]